ncbi:hypothetical protein FOL47_001040 [Perkinsus chesapeaki]|uniref:Integrase catalytic domain-containing protein n=1 Tax=Perkinsus chesapeaki TaxID=330153 RepID=A0A7J6KVG0_PERCH|nr:hypothetical protein FOL47_001040 [Perkinsus chesapeaki]
MTFKAGRPSSSSSKDAKPILAKYMAMVNVLFSPLQFGRRIFIERISTSENPADSLTRHPLLTKFLVFAKSSIVEVCSVSSSPPGNGPLYGTMITTTLHSVAAVCAVLPSLSDRAEKQEEDNQIQQVREAISCHDKPKQQVHPSYMLVWHTLLVREGLLMRHVPTTASLHPNDVAVVPVIPATLVSQILTYYHDPSGCSHIGIHRTIGAIKRKYWFPGLARAVCDHISKCEGCVRQQLRRQWKQNGSQRTAPPSPWHTIVADTVSASTPRGHILLLTLLCQFSHWPEVFILHTKGFSEIAECLRAANCRYGNFKILVTDRGTEFQGAVTDYLRHIGAAHSITLPYSPQAAIEQFNKTLLQKLQATFYTSSWSMLSMRSIIDEILWSLRSTV